MALQFLGGQDASKRGELEASVDRGRAATGATDNVTPNLTISVNEPALADASRSWAMKARAGSDLSIQMQTPFLHEQDGLKNKEEIETLLGIVSP